MTDADPFFQLDRTFNLEDGITTGAGAGGNESRMLPDGFKPGGSGEGGGIGMPPGVAGDMLYHTGAAWVILAAPSGFTASPVLRHNGTAPFWDEPTGCT